MIFDATLNQDRFQNATIDRDSVQIATKLESVDGDDGVSGVEIKKSEVQSH